MKSNNSFNLCLIIIFLFISQFSFSNTIVVFVDNTRNLDYFVNGKKYKLKKDLKELKREYTIHSPYRLILVDIKKYREDKIRGKITVLGKGKRIKKRFKSKESLKLLLKENVTAEVDFLLLSHTISVDRLDDFLSFSNTKYGLILASACKMASVEKLKIMSKYSSYAIASPINIHLAHLEIKQLSKNLIGSNIEKGKRLLDKSFSRLLNFTKSNLVINLYDLSSDVVEKNTCTSKDFERLIIDYKIKLSLFEKRNKSSSQFKLLDCLE